MKSIIIFAGLTLLAVSLVSSLPVMTGCAHMGKLVVCGVEVAPTVPKRIQDALDRTDWQTELAKLAGEYSECVVRQIVADIVTRDESTALKASPNDPVSLRVQRGKAYLAGSKTPAAP